MPYQPPSNKDLQKATFNLQQRFNQIANRYCPPEYAALTEGIHELEKDYIMRANKKKKKGVRMFVSSGPDPVRLEQIGFIRQLAAHMPAAQCADLAKTEQARQILLGALFYRYLRIENSYLVSNSTHSALVGAISALLKMSEENIVDYQTQTTCLTEFQSYLKRPGVAAQFTYIKEDPLYFNHLQNLINHSSEHALPVSKQLSCIASIQSVCNTLIQYEQEAMDILTQLLTALNGEIIKETASIGDKEIEACLESIKPSSLMKYLFINYFLPETIDVMHSEKALSLFKKDMTSRIEMYSQYALLGMYILVLNKYPDKNAYLYRSLAISIQISFQNQLDNKTRELALATLNYFVEAPVKFDISDQVWNGWEIFKAEVIRQLSDVQADKEEENLANMTL